MADIAQEPISVLGANDAYFGTKKISADADSSHRRTPGREVGLFR